MITLKYFGRLYDMTIRNTLYDGRGGGGKINLDLKGAWFVVDITAVVWVAVLKHKLISLP